MAKVEHLQPESLRNNQNRYPHVVKVGDWDLGQDLASKYSNRNQRAERIFTFVRDRVVYTSDLDQFGTNEYAQNADEMATAIVKSRSAKGDCDYPAGPRAPALLATLYLHDAEGIAFSVDEPCCLDLVLLI
jgi:hypothetical protein